MQDIKDNIVSITAQEKVVGDYNYVLNIQILKGEIYGYVAACLHNKVSDVIGLPGKRWSFSNNSMRNEVSFYFVDKSDLTFWNLKFK